MTLHNNDRAPGMPPKTPEEIKNDAFSDDDLKKLVSDGSIDTAIALLSQIRDGKQNIETYQGSTFFGQTSDIKTLFRDASNDGLTPPNKESDAVALQITALSFIQAAHDLLKIYQQDTKENKEKVAEFFNKNFQDRVKQDPQQALNELIHNNLKPFLAEKLCFSEKKALESLYDARNFVPLYQDPQTVKVAAHDVATITALNIEIDSEKTPLKLIQKEEIRGELTDELKEEFNKCKDEDPEKQPEWFRAQSPEHRAIIRYHIPAILEGRQISSQLREMIPGVKNFAKQKVGVVELDEQGKEKIMWLTEVNHCGTIACLIPGVSQAERQRISNLNAAQLRKLTRAEDEDHFVLTTLNSAKNPFGNDNQIVWQTLKALTEGANNLPLNLLRLVSSNNDEGMRRVIQAVLDIYLEEAAAPSDGIYLDNNEGIYQENIRQFLSGQASFREIPFDDIQKMQDEDLSQKGVRLQQVRNMVVLACRLKSRLDRRSSLLDPDNENLSRLSLFHQLCHIFNFYADIYDDENQLSGRKAKRVIPTVACQTGKDRVGLAAMMTAITGVMSHLISGGANISAKNRDTVRAQIAEQLAKSGHQQHMAAARGCSLGCWGLVRDARFAMPSWFTEKTRRFLMRDTAKNNHPNIAKPKKGEKYRQDPSDKPNEFQQFRSNSIKKLESYIRSRQRKLKYGGWFYTVKALKIKVHAAETLVHELRCAKEGDKLGDKIKKANTKNLLAKKALQTRYTKSCCMFAFKPTDGQFGVLIDELSRGFSAPQASKSQMGLEKNS